MMDKTDVASLKNQIDTAADIIRDLTDRLEAERQRADVAWEHWKACQAVLTAQAEKIIVLNWEVTVLKAKSINPFEVPPVELVNGGCILCGKLHPAGMQCPRLRVTSIKGEL